MDYTKELKHVSLCAGYGGIDLGLARALRAVRTIAFVEIESFAALNLVKKIEAGHLDECPVFTDLKAFPWELYRGRVDILSGGFPCQPFSSAGRRAGDSDPRHLWPYIADGVRRLGHPPLIFLENVEGIISSKLTGSEWSDPEGTPVLLHVLRELERLGYEATAGIFSASEVGAPHQRKRVFILGCRSDLSEAGRELVDELLRETERGRDVGNDARRGVQGSFGRWRSEQRGSQIQDRESGTEKLAHTCDVWPAARGAEQYPWEPPRVTMGNALHRDKRPRGQAEALSAKIEDWQAAEPAWSDHDSGERVQRQAEPSLGRNPYGLAGGLGYAKLCESLDSRTDELRMLGNGVVPATAERAFRVLWREQSDKFTC